jgi:hypothetical protein
MITRIPQSARAIAAVAIAALGGCDEVDKPDLELARAVRAGAVEACIRGAEWIPGKLSSSVWNTHRNGDLMTGVVAEPVVRLAEAPRLTGSTPGNAVFCTVAIAIDDPASPTTAIQAYEISLGNDLGRDFADINLRGAVGVKLYAEASEAVTGGVAVWDPSDLACSRRNPRALVSQAIASATVRSAVARWRRTASDRGISLPDWTRTIGDAAGRARQGVNQSTRLAFAGVCDPRGCDRGAATIVFDPTDPSDQPTGLLRTQARDTGRQIYRAFGFDAGSALGCAHMAMAELRGQ